MIQFDIRFGNGSKSFKHLSSRSYALVHTLRLMSRCQVLSLSREESMLKPGNRFQILCTDPHNMPRLLLPSFGKGVYVNKFDIMFGKPKPPPLEIEVVDLPLETIGGRRFETLAQLEDWFESQKRDRAERLSQGLPAESTLFTPPGMDFWDSWWDRVQRVYWTWHHFLTQGKQHD